LVSGVADAAPIQVENDLKLAKAIRSNSGAVKRIHEAVAMVVAADAKQNPKTDGQVD
jgi:hypothetical protein